MHRLFFLLIAGSLAAGTRVAVVAPQADVGNAAKAQVTLSDIQEKGLYSIHGSFETASPPEAVWRVLSDYEGLAGIVSGLKSSRVLERSGDEALIEQVMEGHFLFFGKELRLRLKVKEQEPRLIEFSNVSPQPFRSYQGSWSITPLPEGCRADYILNVSRGDVAPRFLERNLFRTNSLNLMVDLSHEVERRALALKTPAPAIPASLSLAIVGNPNNAAPGKPK